MLFISDPSSPTLWKRVSLSDIRANLGVAGNEVLEIIQKGLNEVEAHGFPVVFKYAPGLQKYNAMAGRKEGKAYIGVNRTASLPTRNGSVTIVSCDSATPLPGGGYDFMPRRFPFNKARIVFNEDDIELVLFLKLFCPNVTQAKQIVFEDLEGEARKLAHTRGANSALSFYLYDPNSVISDNKEKLEIMARMYGVSHPERLGIHQLKNSIYDAVEAAEFRHDANFGIQAFVEAVKSQNPFLDVVAVVQQAIDLKVLDFSDKTFAWTLAAPDGLVVKASICRVNPVEVKRKKEILSIHLMTYPEDFTLLKETMAGAIQGSDKLKIPVLSDVTTEGPLKGKTWAEIVVLAKENDVKTAGRKKEAVVDELSLKLTEQAK